MDNAGGGEVQEADAVGELFVLVFDGVGAEEAEAALQFLQLLACHRVVGEVFGAFGHDGAILAYSLFVRLYGVEGFWRAAGSLSRPSGTRVLSRSVPRTASWARFGRPIRDFKAALMTARAKVKSPTFARSNGEGHTRIRECRGLASLARPSEDGRYVRGLLAPAPEDFPGGD